MKIVFVVLSIVFSTASISAQRPGVFIFVGGFWQGLRIQRILTPSYVRTRVLYEVPGPLFPSYRRNLERQIFMAQLEPLEQRLLPTNQEIPAIEAFGIPDELRNDPAGMLRLLDPAQVLAEFGIATSDPEISSYTLRPGMRNIAIIALGVMANIHIETAGAMREQNFARDLVNEQLGRAHHLMGLQIQHLVRALDDNQDVAAVMQEIFENRETLGYVPPQIHPRVRFWGGFRGFWNGASR